MGELTYARSGAESPSHASTTAFASEALRAEEAEQRAKAVSVNLVHSAELNSPRPNYAVSANG